VNEMAQLENGKRWYLMDLDNYTREFLAEIVVELNEKLEKIKDAQELGGD
jgi:hypothetical protein